MRIKRRDTPAPTTGANALPLGIPHGTQVLPAPPLFAFTFLDEALLEELKQLYHREREEADRLAHNGQVDSRLFGGTNVQRAPPPSNDRTRNTRRPLPQFVLLDIADWLN